MKLVQFSLEQPYSYDNADKPLRGRAQIKLENGTRIEVELTAIQAEQMAQAVAEMLLNPVKNVGSELRGAKISVPRVENLLEG